MSGSPRASRIEKYYRIDYASGISMAISAPPDEVDPSAYIGEKFYDFSKPYEKKLAAILPPLNQLMERYAKEVDSPIMPYEPSIPMEGFVFKTSIETSERDKQEQKARKELLRLKTPAAQIEFPIDLPQADNILLFSIALSSPIDQSQLEEIKNEVALLFPASSSINEMNFP